MHTHNIKKQADDHMERTNDIPMPFLLECPELFYTIHWRLMQIRDASLMNLNFIGLTGFSGAGKTTLARKLKSKTVAHLPMAVGLRSYVYDFHGLDPNLMGDKSYETPELTNLLIEESQKVLDLYKSAWLGCFIENAFHLYLYGGFTTFICDDVRQLHEALLFYRLGGTVIHIKRASNTKQSFSMDGLLPDWVASSRVDLDKGETVDLVEVCKDVTPFSMSEDLFKRLTDDFKAVASASVRDNVNLYLHKLNDF